MNTVRRTAQLLMLTLVLLAAGQTAAPAQEVKGHLMIIGGGSRVGPILDRFIELAGGAENARIIVLPHASGEPDTSGIEQAAELRAHGAKHVEWFLFDRVQAMTPECVKRFEGVTGVFFTGGDQVRITKAMRGTPVHERIRELYRNGAVIGGTSAGAAIMSAVMITGEELRNKDSSNAFSTIMPGNVETIEGLGFVQTAVIDQHFVKRRRLNRLISVALEHPELPGIGIDESTAVQVNPDMTCEVLGRGDVVVVDARHAGAIHTGPNGQFGARGIVLHLFCPGERFNLRIDP